LDQWPGVAQLTAFRPQLTVAVIILAGLGLGTRLRYKSLVFLLIGVISAGGLLSRIVGDTAPQTGTQLRVLTLNVTRDSTDQVELIRLIRTETPHVIALPEASKPYVTELVASFAGEYTAATDVRRARDPERRRPGYENEPANAAATSVLVRSEVPTEFRPATPYTTLGSMQLTIELQGRQVDIQVVHAHPPLPFAEYKWMNDLELVSPSCRTSRPTVVLGDFNATLDHTALHDMLVNGCSDSAEQVGAGLTGTWPQDAPRWLGAMIDHVLVAGPGLSTSSVEIIDVPGGDHRAVSVGLRLQ